MKRKLQKKSAGSLLLLALYAGISQAAYELNMQPPQTAIAEQLYSLHNWILIVCLVIFLIVFGVMFYSIYKHRKSVGHKAAHFHENTAVEIIWTAVPLLILLGMAWPATRTVLEMKDTRSPDLTIKVTGYQWKWGYDYLQEGVSFYSNLATPREQIDNFTGPGANKNQHYLLEVDNPLVVPTGKKVRLVLTADDVIHAWWVPMLGVKQDAIPGFIRDTWFKAERPGIYRGQCAELCGKDHGFMPIVVEAKTPEDYAKWLEEQKAKMAASQEDPNKVWTLADLKARGEKIYTANCVACHQATGQGIPGTFPALVGSKIATGPKEGHIHIVLNGTPKGMPTFAGQLSDTDLAAVITYERNNWGNNTGDLVQPSEVKASRK